MTTVSQIITDAFRQSNLLAIGSNPTTNQITEALRYLNRIVKSVFGNEGGEALIPYPLGTNNINAPNGFPWEEGKPYSDWFIPKNTRLMLNLTESLTLDLHPMPDDGTRFGIVDVPGNLATYNLIIRGNGRTVEDSSSITINTNGTNREWFYRQDQGNWFRTTDLLDSDTFPFPEEFDDMFITLLALRLNPSYGAALDEQSQIVLRRSRGQFRSRYHNTIEKPVELALLRPSRLARDRDYWHNDYYYSDPNSIFNRGLPW